MLNPQQRAALIAAMTRDSPAVRTIDAGYTYLGQFIAHDITEQVNPRNNHRPTAALDLDSLYGTAVPAVIEANGRFVIGVGQDGVPDLLRDSTGRARIPELRNDDNVIVAQLHVFWQRLHNFLLDEGLADDFDAARALTAKAFQLVIVEDYLQLLLAPTVFQQYFRQGQRHWLNLPSTPVPPLFTKAAFRFGHSMVRDFYEIGGQPRDTIDLFQSDRPLQGQLRIDWRRFFDWVGKPTGVQDALAIDTRVTPMMANIPVPPGQQVSIVDKNILASESLQKTGSQFLQEFMQANPDLATTFGLQLQTQLSADLTVQNLGNILTVADLPLWPYLLNEAANEAGGERLGTFGSLICAEVLANSIADAQLLSWPLTFADALAALGPLGQRIEALAIAIDRPLPTPQRPGRRFCMRHLIELLETTSTH